MPAPKETEIKLELPVAQALRLKDVPLLRRCHGKERNETLVSVYYDTKQSVLRKNGLTLRVRRNGRRYVQTIKAGNAGFLDRDEWETVLDGEKPDLGAARGTALEPLLSKKLQRRLRPVFETRVRRTIYPIVTKSSEITLAIDRGRIAAGDRAMPLCEVEIELMRGDKAALFQVARSLAEATSAELAFKSKAQRGYELLDGAAADTPAPARLTPDMSARKAFHAIGTSCLTCVIGNKPAMLAGRPDGLHQMRVGIRRLLAAMSLFSGILDHAEATAIKAELKWLIRELGPAREFEVFLTRVVAPVARRRARLQEMQSLLLHLTAQRTAALERALVAVRSKRFRDLMLNAAAWLEIGTWLDPADDALRKRGDMSIEAFAAAQLTRSWTKIRKKGRMLAKLDPHRRHRLRIQAKKMRYAAEFFEKVFSGRKASKRYDPFLSALKELQDCLGELNDISVHEKLTTAITGSFGGTGDDRPERAFAAGLLTQHEEARLGAVLAAASQSWKRLAKARPFWT